LFPIERQQALIQILKEKKSATVADLSHALFIGEATIRRDLEKLGKADRYRQWSEGVDRRPFSRLLIHLM